MMTFQKFSPQSIDSLVRFLFYVLIFWLPYSKAIIEICVISALLLWIIKRLWLWRQEHPGSVDLKSLLSSLKPEPSSLTGPIMFFLLACFLSTISSAFWDRALRGLCFKTAEWFVIYFLIIEFFKEKKQIYLALGIFLFTALATALDGISQFHWLGKDIFFGYPLTVDHRASAAFGRPNALGGFLTMVIPVAISGLFLENRKINSAVIPLLLSIFVWALVLTFSRAAWLAVIFAVLILTFWAKRRLFVKVAIAIGVGAAILTAVFLTSPEIRKQFRLSDETIFITTNWRWHIWKDSLGMIKEKPLLGHGLNTYMMLFQEYRGNMSGAPKDTWDPTYAHNTLIQLTTETGFLGLFMFLWILGKIFLSSADWGRMVQDSVQRDLRIIQLGCLSGIIAFLIQSIADNNFYSLQLSTLFWFLIGIIFSSGKLLSKAGSCDINVQINKELKLQKI